MSDESAQLAETVVRRSEASAVEIIACITCGSAERVTHGSTRGERLLAELHRANALATNPVKITSERCLWLCKRSCSVHIRSAERPSYVLAELEPSELTAKALVDYAAMYGQSEAGAVPFRQWPDPLRGHFVCRLPASPVNAAAPSVSEPQKETP